MNMSDFFLYSSRNLMDKPVIALNGDIMLGEGFHRINTERMRDEKVMYSLSRYNLIEAGLPCEPKNMRLPKGYLGKIFVSSYFLYFY
ncbi:hypothetical protein EB796_006935 [Bugula neritina]|uniref:Uncharacterized protein n=1 Tax=Bugula neritina TaxID=10212 RepID=A0A7J7K800_BUGNE|nr:hypothetical protein EB796_006935 [Bugula neritina]